MKKKREDFSMATYHQRLFADEGRPRVIVSGSRNFTNRKLVYKKLDKLTAKLKNPIIITGHAKGVDQIAEDWCFARGLNNRRFHAEWFGKWPECGPIRNRAMAKYAVEDGPKHKTFLVAFLVPGSKGTKNMIETAKKFGIKTRIIHVED